MPLKFLGRFRVIQLTTVLPIRLIIFLAMIIRKKSAGSNLMRFGQKRKTFQKSMQGGINFQMTITYHSLKIGFLKWLGLSNQTAILLFSVRITTYIKLALSYKT